MGLRYGFMLKLLIPAILTLLGLVACGGQEDTSLYGGSATPAPSTAAPVPSVTTTAGCTETTVAQSGVDSFNDTVNLVNGPDGLQYGDFRVGIGPMPAQGQKVVVNYTGWLTNGTMFDSSRQLSRQPFAFNVGEKQVITGWDLGVASMRVGGKRRLIVPPQLGYGAAGYPPTIPGNATLIFDVELLAVC